AEAVEQLGDGATATVAVLAQELGETFFTEARGGMRRRVTGEEGQRDGRVDVGEDDRGARPEALEERAELIGDGDALSDEVVAAAHEGPQRARVVRGRAQRGEAVAIRA